jgi:hypothetical protein
MDLVAMAPRLADTWRRLRLRPDLCWSAAVFLAAVLTHLIYLAPGGPSSRSPDRLPISGDEGTVLYDSLRIARGEVMYRDFFEFQGPIFYYTYAGLYAVTGPSVATARALHILVSALASMLIGILVARFAGWLAGAGAAAVHAPAR